MYIQLSKPLCFTRKAAVAIVNDVCVWKKEVYKQRMDDKKGDRENANFFSNFLNFYKCLTYRGIHRSMDTHTDGKTEDSKTGKKEYNQLCWQSQDGCGLHTIISKRSCENSLHLCGRHNCSIRSRNNLNYKPVPFLGTRHGDFHCSPVNAG